jgi:hypothetical protein
VILALLLFLQASQFLFRFGRKTFSLLTLDEPEVRHAFK